MNTNKGVGTYFSQNESENISFSLRTIWPPHFKMAAIDIHVYVCHSKFSN